MTAFHPNRIFGKGKFIFLFLILTVQLYGQKDEIMLGNDYNNLSWISFVEKVESNFDVRFFYHPDSIPAINILVKNPPASIKKVLSENFEIQNIKTSFDSNGNIFLTKGQTLITHLPKDFLNIHLPKKTKPTH